MNNQTSSPCDQKENYEMHTEILYDMLDIIAYDLAVVLFDGVQAFSENPIPTLKRFHLFMYDQLKQKRDHECTEMLRIINGALGLEYDAIANLLSSMTDKRRYYLCAFVTELGELLENR